MQTLFERHTGRITVSKQSAYFSLRRLQRYLKQHERNLVRFPDLLIDATADELVVYSSSGIIVHWGAQAPVLDSILTELVEADAIEEPLLEPYTLAYDYAYSTTAVPNIDDDADALSLNLFDMDSLVAVSSAYVKSVQIDYNELVVDSLVEDLRLVPAMLAKRGVVRMGIKKTRKMLGKILQVQHTLSMSLLAKDYPDHVWDDEDHVALYKMVIVHFDVQERWEILKEKLETLHATAELLRTDKEASTTLFLEWMIVLLFIFDIALYFLGIH